MKTINVTASRWSGGWELEITENKHTQVRHLANARQQVVDYLDSIDESQSHETWVINIIPDIGNIRNELKEAQTATHRALKAQEKAALKTRKVVKTLISEGYTKTDIATLMGVSRARISQLAKEA